MLACYLIGNVLTDCRIFTFLLGQTFDAVTSSPLTVIEVGIFVKIAFFCALDRTVDWTFIPEIQHRAV